LFAEKNVDAPLDCDEYGLAGMAALLIDRLHGLLKHNFYFV
jgi:hypothetical protein